MIYLFYFVFSLLFFFDCMNVRLAVKYVHVYTILEFTLLCLCLLNSSLTIHYVYWACCILGELLPEELLLFPVSRDLLFFPLVPIHVFSMYVFTMLKVIQTFRSIEIVLLNCWKDLNFELQRAFVMPYILLLY